LFFKGIINNVKTWRQEINKLFNIALFLIICVAILPHKAFAQCTDPVRDEGIIVFNPDHSVPQYCDGTNWQSMGARASKPEPAGCITIGDLCTDGSYYAGSSPDGSSKMYMADITTEVLGAWNNGTSTYITIGLDSTADGDGNSRILLGRSDGASPYNAAVNCENLIAHGHSDWYLPAIGELQLIYNGGTPIGDIRTDGTRYWSSTERDAIDAYLLNFNVGAQLDFPKDINTYSIRCVRNLTPPYTTVVDEGLVAHWMLDETSGTAVIDYVSNNHGRMFGGLNGATSNVTGRVRSALTFDNVNDYISVDAGFQPAADFTYSAWIYPYTTGDEMILMFGDGTGANELFFALASGQLWTYTNGVQRAISSNLIPANQWSHIVITRSGSNVTQYINANIDGQGTDGVALVTTCPVLIGVDADTGCSAGLGNYFNGHIDDVRVYNRALSEEEILELYDAWDGHIRYNINYRAPEYFSGSSWEAMGKPKPTNKGLIGHWKLDETSGTFADSSGNGNDGTQSGGVEYASSGVINYAAGFDGVDDYIDVGPNIYHFGDGATDQPFSMSAWVFIDNLVDDFRVFNKCDGGQEYILSVDDVTAYPQMALYDANTVNRISADAQQVIPLQEWTHIAWSYNAGGTVSDMKFYVNGVQITSINDTSLGTYNSMNISGADFIIGRSVCDSKESHGKMDDLRIQFVIVKSLMEKWMIYVSITAFYLILKLLSFMKCPLTFVN
jgi:hypothetical protein